MKPLGLTVLLTFPAAMVATLASGGWAFVGVIAIWTAALGTY